MENFNLDVLVPTILSGLLGIGIIADKAKTLVKFAGKWINVTKEAIDVLDAIVNAIKIKEGETTAKIDADELENIKQQIAELKGAIKV